MGALNADLLCGSHDARLVRNLAAELPLQLDQHGPSHFNSASLTWIDMIFVDDNDTIINDRNIPVNFHSKHNIIDVTIKISTTVKKALHLLIETIRKSCQKSSPGNYLAVIGQPLTLTSLIPLQALDCLCAVMPDRGVLSFSFSFNKI